ncbi:NAD-dependent deacetylase [Desulfocicer vacuolatum DSM 3385]|uniref:protein acetyllysine N-acetyltransferase n=1 Tax=Desulfocicer vacuolatum DSM 3385 TaxID=1121400 RepID=A0A1W2AW24_9BACT|nr:Sir2 family NAD-dependent protein deacetylase [Desulfocicer vacuolatum]SMC64651.1 NAD-dependent deacetylase [Desulfocicer vacuolatum DSM 3385]
MVQENLLKEFRESGGRLTVLTGAGISAESGIPTFRGPEGYWTVGSTEYRPEEMATRAMFEKNPWEVWAWYLYRRTVCRNAGPNDGHKAVVEMESLFNDEFRLITQNVDGLHLQAGNSNFRTFQIHGNLHFMRCANRCSHDLFPFPAGIGDKERDQKVSEMEKNLLKCPRCHGLARPHVLWFDEYYDERFFQAQTALKWAGATDLLMVVGTAGATNLPMQIGRMVAENPQAILIDINLQDNPFRALAKNHPRGIVLDGPGGEHLRNIVSLWRGLARFTTANGSGNDGCM